MLLVEPDQVCKSANVRPLECRQVRLDTVFELVVYSTIESVDIKDEDWWRTLDTSWIEVSHLLQRVYAHRVEHDGTGFFHLPNSTQYGLANHLFLSVTTVRVPWLTHRTIATGQLLFRHEELRVKRSKSETAEVVL